MTWLFYNESRARSSLRNTVRPWQKLGNLFTTAGSTAEKQRI